jgi:hypothetical protein
MRRIGLSLLIAVAAFIISFIAFNFVYIEWAVWRYPQTNSMAGMTAFFLGIPVGTIFAIISYAIAFYWIGRKASN